MAKELNVEVVAADRKVWSGSASIVIARTPDGEVGVMAGHEPVLAVLVTGPVTVRTADGGAVVAAVSGGFLSVSEDRVAVLAEQAVLAEEVDAVGVEAEIAQLQGADDEAARQWAEARLGVASHR
ncbi:F0F1 ATP synthase subunit epsilon [Haloactinopolyspora alba]|uniref:F0F1 ATP synthase subunit epsilon n=1 Tax=Haloactinopolyspora alba TaxID=648780 RepID=UPI000D0DE2B2|nr:F0F1 ATP synthase subunit epsilon [Haloactinopolyspora alba]